MSWKRVSERNATRAVQRVNSFVHAARRLRKGPRRYLRANLSFVAFLKTLDEREVLYAPLTRPNESAQECGTAPRILIRDADVKKIDDLISRLPLGLPVRIYSTSGSGNFGVQISSSEFHTAPVALFPPRVAEGILRRIKKTKEGTNRICEKDELFIQAYMAAYFGEGLKIKFPANGNRPDLSFDWVKEFLRLASLGEPTCGALPAREKIEQLLAAHGWRPPLDMLERLAINDAWIQSTVIPQIKDDGHPQGPHGLAIFFLRRRTVESQLHALVRSAVVAEGFELLDEVSLSGATEEWVAQTVRGGNWAKGPWPEDGGPPARALILLDVFPLPPSEALLRNHPHLDNARVYSAKLLARERVKSKVGAPAMFNPVHSTDNSFEAWRCAAAVLAPDDLERVRRTCERRFAALPPPSEPVRELNSQVRRAHYERIQYRGTTALRKTFRHQYRHMLNCEANVLRRLSSRLPELPKLLDQSETSLIIEDVAREHLPLCSIGHGLWQQIPLRQVLRLRQVLMTLLDNGCDPLDWNPAENLLMSVCGRSIKLVGFEEALWRMPPVGLDQAFCLNGIGTDHEAASGEGLEAKSDPYPTLWRPYLGVSRQGFIRGEAWRYAIERNFIYPIWLALSQCRRARARLGRLANKGLVSLQW